MITRINLTWEVKKPISIGMIHDYSRKEVRWLWGQIKDCNEETAMQIIGDMREDTDEML